MVDELRNDVAEFDDALEAKSKKLVTYGESSQKSIGSEMCVKKDKGKGKEDESVVKNILQPLPFSSEAKAKERRREVQKVYYYAKRVKFEHPSSWSA